MTGWISQCLEQENEDQHRIVGDAQMHRGLLDRESLRAEDGVKYFRDTLKPHFKGTQSVFLWRFYQFIRARRGNIEMVKCIGKFSLLLMRIWRRLDAHATCVHHERGAKRKPSAALT